MSKIDNIKPDDSSFNLLMQTLLGDLMKDLTEAERNVKRYEDMLVDEEGKVNEMNLAMYGSLLNDALKIKAAVRDKIIKMLGALKDRVKVKEQQASAGNSSEDYSEEMISSILDRVMGQDKENKKDKKK